MKIIVSCKNDKEKNGRLTLLKKISYYYELYDWKALLQFYAAWIRRVESGQNKWSDDTADIETPLLASSVRSRQNRVSNKSASIVKAPSVWFCSDFQKKKCSFSGAHDKVIKGVTRSMLSMYHDSDVVNILGYGFPLRCKGSYSGLSVEENHAGARSHPDDMRKYLKKECTYGSIIGPFFSNPFETDMVISPLNSVPKKDTLDRKVILDLSFGVDGEDSVNSHICKDLYLVQIVCLCDSTLVGCGGICNGRYFHTVFPAFIRRKQLHINALELLCVMMCLKVWASVLEGSKIVIYCDNSSSVSVLNSGACRNAFMQSCLREICFLTASHEFQVKGRHLSGEANRVADMLSRWDMDPGISTEFLKQARINSWTEIELDDDLFHFTSPW
ncbi:unnamed protein product [Mytilus coruscus]|uniref:RNase H type-1 domain-containing protein n=1 Tax=Mytilus coruscus TaxID=42192 RepID=A0A6J8EEE4_MYTCO|nr:unnamed protein product [Mytilus coruscus]